MKIGAARIFLAAPMLSLHVILESAPPPELKNLTRRERR
jgi:hypothetical protein